MNSSAILAPSNNKRLIVSNETAHGRRGFGVEVILAIDPNSADGRQMHALFRRSIDVCTSVSLQLCAVTVCTNAGFIICTDGKIIFIFKL